MTGPSVDQRMIPIGAIIADDDCQLRAAGSDAAISDYADALSGGAVFPPITVYTDGSRFWLADGFHRLEAHRRAGRTEIAALVHDGDKRAAVLHASGANADHGLRRTQEDKRKAILRLLQDPEWRQWTDREIARRTVTDHKTVAKLRRELSGEGGEIPTRRALSASQRGEIPSGAATARGGAGGEIPSGRPLSASQRGEIPSGGGLLDKVLASIGDAALLAEARRRGLIGGAAHE